MTLSFSISKGAKGLTGLLWLNWSHAFRVLQLVSKFSRDLHIYGNFRPHLYNADACLHLFLFGTVDCMPIGIMHRTRRMDGIKDVLQL